MEMQSTQTDAATILIVDDHQLVREGIAGRLAVVPDLAVVGAADDWLSALAEIERLSPDIVLLDVQTSNGRGLELAGHLATAHPTVVVVLHSTSDLTVEQFDASGAAAVVLKQLIGDSLVETLRSVSSERVLR